MTLALPAHSHTFFNAAALAGGTARRDQSVASLGQTTSKEESEVRDSLSATLEAVKNAPEEARQFAQNRARERVEAVREQLKLVKALYAENPEGMAKALRHLVKELNTALKAYKDAGGDTANLGAGATSTPAPAPAQTPAAAPSDTQSHSGNEVEATASSAQADTQTQMPDDPSAPVAEPDRYETSLPVNAGPSLEALDARKGVLKGDEEFINTVDGLTRKIRDLFETAKIKSAFLARDKDRANAFEALDDDLGELEEGAFEYKRDIQDALISVDLQTKLMERTPTPMTGLDIAT